MLRAGLANDHFPGISSSPSFKNFQLDFQKQLKNFLDGCYTVDLIIWCYELRQGILKWEVSLYC